MQEPFHYISKRQSAARSGRTGGYLWFHLSIASGVALAVVLLVSSISTYIAVSRGLIVEHLRGDLHSQEAMMEEQAQRNSVQTRDQLSQVLQHAVEQSSGRITWVIVRNAEGDAIATAGSPSAQVFSAPDIRSRIQNHRPVFKIAGAPKGPILVEVLPFMLPPGPLRPVRQTSAGEFRHPMATVEIAEFWGGTDVALWSVRRHLMVNLAAALTLLIALSIIALRFRSYLAGRKLEQEVEIASSVQRDLLPSSRCDLDGFEIAGDYMPASPVGGDFYDAFSVPGGAAFVLGDVSGKGIPAALLMGVLHGAVRSSAWNKSPREHREATRQMNRLLCQRASSARFATMFWAYFDSASQHLKYINAGHCPPLLLNRSHRNAILHLAAGGPVLGVLAGAEFQQGSVRLDPGDILVLYSDGIVEATNDADEEFGEDRVLAAVRAHAGDTAEEIRNHILDAVDAFAGTAAPQDDQTLVVIAYTGAAQHVGNPTDQPASEIVAYAA